MAPKDFQTASSVRRREIVTSSRQKLGLARFLKEDGRHPALDSKTVFLVNSKGRKRIDRITKAYLWPGIIKALVGTPIRVSQGKEAFPASILQDEQETLTTRSLTFSLEDADIPFLQVNIGSLVSAGFLGTSPNINIRFSRRLARGRGFFSGERRRCRRPGDRLEILRPEGVREAGIAWFQRTTSIL